MDKMAIHELIDCCVSYLKESNYAESTIKGYRKVWNGGILKFMQEGSISVYSPDIGEKFVCERVLELDESPSKQNKLRSIRVLDDYLRYGQIRRKDNCFVERAFDGLIGNRMQEFLNHFQKLGRCYWTVRHYKLILSSFLTYLTSNGVNSPDDIKECHLLKFVSSTSHNMTQVLTTLRTMLRFWFENHIIGEDKELILKNYRWPHKERIPSFYSGEEILKIESSIDRANASGKRSYAMLLLATRLGLRSSDIASLTFGNIDWVNSRIILTQYKTSEPIELPLLTDVGNAIIDYIKYGRKQSDSKRIFITCSAPYRDVSSFAVSNLLGKVISDSGVSIQKRHHGPHAMRHSLATTMLANGSTFPVISEVLGHRNTSSTMKYLKIDLDSLKKCALPVPCVKDEFYKQEGGVLYE